jgi:hypothetical protein
MQLVVESGGEGGARFTAPQPTTQKLLPIGYTMLIRRYLLQNASTGG